MVHTRRQNEKVDANLSKTVFSKEHNDLLIEKVKEYSLYEKGEKLHLFVLGLNESSTVEIYRMALKRDKDSIEFQKDDTTNRNQIFFDFMLRMFNHLTQLYGNEKSLLIDSILKYQSRDESAKEVEEPNRYNNTRNRNKKDTSKPSKKKVVL